MSHADVVPIGARGKPGRGSGTSRTPSAASRSLAVDAPSPSPVAPPATPEASGQKGSRAAGRKAKAAPGARAGTTPSASGRAGTTPSASGRAGMKPPTGTSARSTAPSEPPPRPGPGPAPAGGGDAAPGSAPEADSDAAYGPGPGQDGPAAGPVDFELPSTVAELLGLLGDTAYSVFGPDADKAVAEVLAFARRRLTGDYDVDSFGLDSHLTETLILPLLRPLYDKWFRVEVKGAENIPTEGGALIVANHSGTIAVDAVMTAFAVHDETPNNRILRMLGADFVFSLPFVGEMSRKTGSTLACAEDGHRLLTSGELVGVWPEGFKGIGKPYRERYRLQRFGRGGFVSSAITAAVPIIPTAIVGAEEIYPIIGNLPLVARLLGSPYFPVTPLFPWLGPLGMIPLPSKWIIEFGEPIATDQLGAEEADDPMVVFNIGDQVRESIQHNLYQLLQERRSIFF